MCEVPGLFDVYVQSPFMLCNEQPVYVGHYSGRYLYYLQAEMLDRHIAAGWYISTYLGDKSQDRRFETLDRSNALPRKVRKVKSSIFKTFRKQHAKVRGTGLGTGFVLDASSWCCLADCLESLVAACILHIIAYNLPVVGVNLGVFGSNPCVVNSARIPTMHRLQSGCIRFRFTGHR